MAIKNYCDISQQKKRLRTILVLVTIFTFVVIGRLLYLQIYKHNYYVKLASKQHWAKDIIPASRGKILVRDDYANGYYPLADNKKMYYVYASPEEIKDKNLASRQTAQIIGKDEKEIENLLLKNHTYVVLARRLDFEKSEKLKKLNIEGLYVEEEEVRYYPEGTLAAQILGYVDTEGKGKYGLEQYFEEELAGVPGQYRAEIDPSGKKISFGKNIQVAPKNGVDLVLTINRDIQVQAEKLVQESVKKFSAENGSIIVMNPENGEIVAMANYPTFDPNNYQDVKDYNIFKNISATDVYEPGSIFKVITTAAGLDTGKIEPETKFEDKGSVTLNGHKIMNSDKKAHGWVDMKYVLAQSLNTGTVFVLDKIGKNVFFDYLKKFGFGKQTGIEQPNEGYGKIFSPHDKGINDHTYATMTFGQSLTATPIQMITSFATIANKGKSVKPHLIAEKHYSNGKIEKTKKEEGTQVISREAAEKETELMIEVVETGHGKTAKVKGYKIAGKTGTAQVPKKNGLGYETGKNIGSFIGFGPAQNPKFVVMAKIDSPKGIPWAESSAAPIVGQMLDFLFKYYQIPTTEPM